MINMTKLNLDIKRLEIFDEKYKEILKKTYKIRNIAKFYRNTKNRIKKINKQNIIIEEKFINMLNLECSKINTLMDRYDNCDCVDIINEILFDITARCYILNSILNNIEAKIQK